MFSHTNLFNTILIIPILNVLMGVYNLLRFIGIPGTLGFSLIIMTVLIRLLLSPLTAAQIKSTQKLNKIKPHLDKLTQKYKNDKMRLQQEQLNLYKQAGINPAAGCLPLLLQMPILIALYNMFFQLLSNGNIEKVTESINSVVYFPFLKIQSLDLSFFGMNLAHKPSEWQKLGWFMLLIPVITGALQYWQTKLMTPNNATLESKKSGLEQVKSSSLKQDDKKEKQEEKKEDDMGTAMQKQMSIMMPLMIGFFAYNFPLGLSLYWNTFTVFGIIQQYQLNKEMENKNEK
jgi:YidC/Oxa1 family membrane protein insertase